jgi:hypothetical protein
MFSGMLVWLRNVLATSFRRGEHEGGNRVDHGHRHQPEEPRDEPEDDVQALAVGQLVPDVVPGVDDYDLPEEHESLYQKHPEEDVLEVGEEDREQRHQRQHERDRQGGTRGEQEDYEARQVAREPLVARLLRDQPQVLARRGHQDRPDDEGGEEDVRLHEDCDDYVLADYGDFEVAYRHISYPLLAREVHDPADGQ